MASAERQTIAGKYRLERCLARGGMGSVWLARHLDLEVDVALKLLRHENHDEALVARFRREAQAAARLRSPHIVTILDFGVDDGTPYLVMELLLGEDLSLLLNRSKKLEAELAWHLLQQAGSGLRTAHAAGIVHRDIKPGNLFVEETADGPRMKLLDFGIARHEDQGGELTTEGVTWGSPSYMSPEQARGGSLDARSDLWSLAAVTFEMLSGQRPYVGDAAGDVVVKLCTDPPPRVTAIATELPTALDAFFARAFSVAPEGRFDDVDQFLDAAADALNMPRQRLSTHGSLPSGSTLETPTVGRTTETAPLAVGNEVASAAQTSVPLPAAPPSAAPSSAPSPAAQSPVPSPAAPPSAAPSSAPSSAPWSTQSTLASSTHTDSTLKSPPPRLGVWLATLALLIFGLLLLLWRSAPPEASKVGPPFGADEDSAESDPVAPDTGASSLDTTSGDADTPSPGEPAEPQAGTPDTLDSDTQGALAPPAQRADQVRSTPGSNPVRKSSRPDQPSAEPESSDTDPLFGLPVQERGR